MSKNSETIQEIMIPDGFIIFLSGVPGVGKTTISYELFKRFSEFRIIEETDLIREVLRGYNEYLNSRFGEKIGDILKNIQITDYTKLLTIIEAKEQCILMKRSFEQIIARQQRKGIASIINGVHVIPEVLNGIAENKNIIYINLYVTDEHTIYERIVNRDPSSYMLDHIPFIFRTNNDLFLSTDKLSLSTSYVFNINVTNLSINEVIEEIVNCIAKRITNIH